MRRNLPILYGDNFRVCHRPINRPVGRVRRRNSRRQRHRFVSLHRKLGAIQRDRLNRDNPLRNLDGAGGGEAVCGNGDDRLAGRDCLYTATRNRGNRFIAGSPDKGRVGTGWGNYGVQPASFTRIQFQIFLQKVNRPHGNVIIIRNFYFIRLNKPQIDKFALVYNMNTLYTIMKHPSSYNAAFIDDSDTFRNGQPGIFTCRQRIPGRDCKAFIR